MPRRASIQERKATPMKMPAIMPQKPFLQTMKEGMAFGLGSSIGHRIVGSVLGSSSPVLNTKNEEYEKCVKENNDKSGCEYLLRS
jgi:hypothetical protein